MVWESGNGGNFWTDEEKRVRLYVGRQARAAQRRRAQQLKRRILWVSLTMVGVVLAATVARSAAPQRERSAAVSRPETEHTLVVTVAPGDTLWSLARRYSQKGVSTMDNVAVISTLNGEIEGRLEPGQRLVVPAP